MENVRSFFDDIYKKLKEGIDCFESHSKNKYRFLQSIDYSKVFLYRDKIADKLFSMNKDDREIYAGLIIEEIDNNFSENLFQKEEIIDDYNSYKLYRIKNKLGKKEFVDISPIIDDCDSFIVLVFELFLSFKINMQDVAKKFDLQNDYNRFANFDKSALRRFEERKNDKNKNSSNITLSQQILAIQTMLNALGVKYNDANNTKTAAFIQFLLNKEAGVKTRDSYIYEIVRAKEWQITEEKHTKDHNIVADQFEKISLHRLAEQLRKIEKSTF